MSASTKKYIRREKARIRRSFLDEKKQNEEIRRLYERLNNKNISKTKKDESK